jgi:hypothetical protein
MSNDLNGEEHGPFRSVPFVAARIGWHERTIRRRCVSVAQWREEQRASGRTVLEHTMATGTIPALRLGAMWRIPVWWLSAIIDAAENE